MPSLIACNVSYCCLGKSLEKVFTGKIAKAKVLRQDHALPLKLKAEMKPIAWLSTMALYMHVALFLKRVHFLYIWYDQEKVG